MLSLNYGKMIVRTAYKSSQMQYGSQWKIYQSQDLWHRT